MKSKLYKSLLVISSLVVFALVFFFTESSIGERVYHHTRMAQMISDGSFYDDLSYGGRQYITDPYDYLIYLIGLVLGFNLAAIVVPLILGISSILIFDMLLEKTKVPTRDRYLMLFSLLMTPTILYTFTLAGSPALIVLLNLLGLYFYTRRGKLNLVLSIASYSVLSFYGLIYIILPLAVTLIYSINKKENFNRFTILAFTIILVTTSYNIYMIKSNGPKITLPQSTSMTEFFSDFGAISGFGVFNLLLAAIGFGIVWKRDTKLFYLILVFCLINIFIYVIKPELALISFLFSVLSGFGIGLLLDRKWSLELVKTLTFVVIICGLLFSMISYVVRIDNSGLNPKQLDALMWLKNQDRGIVFSDEANGIWIESIANQPTFMDINYDYSPNLLERISDKNEIINSRVLIKTMTLLKKNNITYIYIDSNMRKNIWYDEEDGLIFLFSNNQTFKKIFDNKDAEIFKVISS